MKYYLFDLVARTRTTPRQYCGTHIRQKIYEQLRNKHNRANPHHIGDFDFELSDVDWVSDAVTISGEDPESSPRGKILTAFVEKVPEIGWTAAATQAEMEAAHSAWSVGSHPQITEVDMFKHFMQLCNKKLKAGNRLDSLLKPEERVFEICRRRLLMNAPLLAKIPDIQKILILPLNMGAAISSYAQLIDEILYASDVKHSDVGTTDFR